MAIGKISTDMTYPSFPGKRPLDACSSSSSSYFIFVGGRTSIPRRCGGRSAGRPCATRSWRRRRRVAGRSRGKWDARRCRLSSCVERPRPTHADHLPATRTAHSTTHRHRRQLTLTFCTGTTKRLKKLAAEVAHSFYDTIRHEMLY